MYSYLTKSSKDICQRKTCLIALEENAVLVERYLKMDWSISANFRASLIHLETVELEASTYGWTKLNSNWERLFSERCWYVFFIYSL